MAYLKYGLSQVWLYLQKEGFFFEVTPSELKIPPIGGFWGIFFLAQLRIPPMWSLHFETIGPSQNPSFVRIFLRWWGQVKKFQVREWSHHPCFFSKSYRVGWFYCNSQIWSMDFSDTHSKWSHDCYHPFFHEVLWSWLTPPTTQKIPDYPLMMCWLSYPTLLPCSLWPQLPQSHP